MEGKQQWWIDTARKGYTGTAAGIGLLGNKIGTTGRSTWNQIGTVGQSAVSGAVAAGTVVGAKLAASAAVPVVMSSTGVVVKGVGTMHAAGGVAASLQAFAVAPILVPAISVGVVAGGSYAAYRKVCHMHQHQPARSPASKM